MAVIDAVLVPRWIQDPPAITSGEALFTLVADALVSVPVDAAAALIFDADFQVAVSVLSDAEVAADTILAVSVAVLGDAEVGITAPFTSNDVNLTAAIALVPITASCDVAVPLDVDANIVIFDNSTFAPAVVGSATVAFEDYGQGSPPLFPFQLPTRFTDNPLGIQLAEASITINGFSDDVRVAGFAEAFIDFAGSVELTLFGYAPVFPFAFPVVFSSAVNVLSAEAVLSFDGDADTVVAVLASASVTITSTAVRIDPTVFPFALPGQFIS